MKSLKIYEQQTNKWVVEVLENGNMKLSSGFYPSKKLAAIYGLKAYPEIITEAILKEVGIERK